MKTYELWAEAPFVDDLHLARITTASEAQRVTAARRVGRDLGTGRYIYVKRVDGVVTVVDEFNVANDMKVTGRT